MQLQKSYLLGGFTGSVSTAWTARARCSIAEASDRPPTEARGAFARTSREGLFTTLLPLPCPSTIGGSISRSVLLRSDDDIEFILFKMVNIVAVRSLACCGTVLVYKGRQRSFFLSPLFPPFSSWLFFILQRTALWYRSCYRKVTYRS